MADVPIVTIEIDDAQYRAFEDRVRQFRAQEEAAPGPWGDVAAHVETIRARFEEMAELVARQDAAAGAAAEKTGRAGTGVEAIAAAWGLMHVSGRRFSGSIAGATRDLVRWERLTATFTALLGAGGLFGIDALASAAAARRRRSGGAGVSTGELAAFQTNFGRLGNTDSLLEGFNVAATDVTARQPLQSLGVDPRGKNAFALFVEALPRIKDVVDRTDPRLLGPTLGAYHLDQLGFDENTLRLLRRMTRAEVDDMLRGARGNVSQFEIPDEIGRRWQDLETMLSRAGASVQTALADSLVNIAPGVEHVSESLVKLLDVMLARPELAVALHDVGNGIEAFAGKVGSKDALDVMRRAVDQFRMSRDDFGRLNNWFETHGTLLKRLLGAAVGARIGALVGPEGALVGGLLGGLGWAPTHLEHEATPELDARHRAAGAAGERNASPWNAPRLTLEQRNAERKAFGQKPFATQEEYDKAEPAGRQAPAPPPTRTGPSGPASAIEGDISGDLSGRATYARQNETIDPAAFIVHHTGARGTPEGVVNTLNQRGLGVQYVMDRDGKIYRSLPDGSRGAHILPSEVKGLDLNNSNTIGMEVIARDDRDVTPEEVASAKKFYRDLQKRYPGIGIYGHGYVNPGHKQATEGKTIVDAIRADQGAAPDPVRNPVEAAAASARKIPLAQRGFLGAYSGRDAASGGAAAHPNAKPPTPPVAVHVTDNTGTSAHVEVHH